MGAMETCYSPIGLYGIRYWTGSVVLNSLCDGVAASRRTLLVHDEMFAVPVLWGGGSVETPRRT